MSNENEAPAEPTLDQFLEAVRRDDIALARAAEMSEPIQMWAPLWPAAPTDPLAMFPTEGRAWQWALNEFGAHSNVTVRPFMVSAAPVK